MDWLEHCANIDWVLVMHGSKDVAWVLTQEWVAALLSSKLLGTYLGVGTCPRHYDIVLWSPFSLDLLCACCGWICAGLQGWRNATTDWVSMLAWLSLIPFVSSSIQKVTVATDLIAKQITVQWRLREALKDILLGHQSTAGVINWLWSSCVRRWNIP